METYKGTDKNMQCRGGFQYELGRTYTDDGAIRCGNQGFHSCEVPMDVWTYFQPDDGKRFFACDAGGIVDNDNDDSKIASSELTIKTEIGILGIIKAQIEYVKRFAKGNIAQGYRGHAAAQGDSGHAAAQGDRGHATAQGDRGHATAQGDRGHAEVHGKDSIAVSCGIEGTVQGELGDWICAYEWELTDKWHIKDGKTVRVDGEKIKPNVRYTLKNGEFVEVPE